MSLDVSRVSDAISSIAHSTLSLGIFTGCSILCDCECFSRAGYRQAGPGTSEPSETHLWFSKYLLQPLVLVCRLFKLVVQFEEFFFFNCASRLLDLECLNRSLVISFEFLSCSSVFSDSPWISDGCCAHQRPWRRVCSSLGGRYS